ncbi:restriction endonuclease subunit S [Evansella cellulosilytica]|uniref:Restriction modification system DNA specificity domain n=1 Tax=Evansella cellulosilytica (strain ATCC 21833 / DSM 2522 / FERM P-1141 / JCM 9156 / N-4) TaxID=649639 RepID=E6TZV0_EVAC2|nr:restriction endonuclease subunit S [Evansella cellulosilytica]ADU32516.1 restriction modification system DNA specificity domain [Evansella cellulosilytica DSM 2522]
MIKEKGDIIQLGDGWRLVPFKLMAEHISKRVEPKETKLKYYIGLEHLDSKTLKIKRHGTPEDVQGTKLVAKPGDIIFGKRRAYQGKVAICEWDAIVSAHSMVLRAQEEVIIKELLPFFMQSQEFYNRSLKISEGSLSPTIKWKVLAEEKFIIPPKNIQRDIIEKLNATEDNINCKEILLEKTLKYKEKLVNKLLTRGVNHSNYKPSSIGEIPKDWELKRIDDVCNINPQKEKIADTDTEISFLTMEDISNDAKIINLRERKYSEVSSGFTSFRENDVIVAKITPCFENGKGALAQNLKNSIGFGSTEFHILRAKDEVLPKYIYYHTTNKLFRTLGEWNMTGSAGQKRVPKEFLEGFKIGIPPLTEQRKIVEILDGLENVISNIESNIKNTKKVKEELLIFLFDPKFYQNNIAKV